MRFIDRFIFEQYRPIAEGMGAFRVVFAIYILLALAPQHLWLASSRDAAFFWPPLGPAILLESFPPGWVIYLLNFILILAALSLLVGHHTRLASITLAVSLMTIQTWAYSFGKIDHVDLLPIVAALVLPWTGWSPKHENLQQNIERPAWPVALLALLIGLAMLTAALPKIRGGWLDPAAPATFGHLLKNHYIFERPALLSGMLVEIRSLIFWKAVDYGTILLEGGMVVAALHRRTFCAFLAFACLFHLGVALGMGIVFTGSLIAYAAFVNWSLLLQHRWIARFARQLNGVAERMGGPHVLVGAVVCWGVYIWLGNPWSNTLRWVLFYAASAFATAYLLFLVVRQLHRTGPRPASPVRTNPHPERANPRT